MPARFKIVSIWLPVKRNFFMQNLHCVYPQKFYVKTLPFFGQITTHCLFSTGL